LRQPRFLLIFVAAAGLVLAGLACSTLTISPTPAPAWTPPPAGATAQALSPTPAAVLATVEATAEASTAEPATPAGAEAPAAEGGTVEAQATVGGAEPPAAATPAGPQTVVITDADLADTIKSGALAANGVDATNLQVHFTGGNVRITADKVGYGLFEVLDLVYVGRLVAQDGVLQLDTVSVSPGGVIGALLPTIINQSLRQYTSRWYVEQVHESEGEIELTVR
jgi:hypothetical protein